MVNEKDKQLDNENKNFIADKVKSGRSKKKRISIFVFVVVPVVTVIAWIYFFVFPFYLAVKQHAELFLIATSIEIFNSEFNNYPPSEALDPTGKPYCGALKLCEAILGQDLIGFDPNSVFRSDGMNSDGTKMLYSYNLVNIEKPYISIEQVGVCRLNNIFENTGLFSGNEYVLCDEYKKSRYSGKDMGMPVLYYKADTTKSSHDVNNPDNPDNIYNYKDNYDLLALGVPGKPGVKYPLYEDPSLFYIMTQNFNVGSKSIPFNKDTYILISAGKDGLYGTPDDITNFDFKWRPKEKINK